MHISATIALVVLLFVAGLLGGYGAWLWTSRGLPAATPHNDDDSDRAFQPGSTGAVGSESTGGATDPGSGPAHRRPVFHDLFLGVIASFLVPGFLYVTSATAGSGGRSLVVDLVSTSSYGVSDGAPAVVIGQWFALFALCLAAATAAHRFIPQATAALLAMKVAQQADQTAATAKKEATAAAAHTLRLGEDVVRLQSLEEQVFRGVTLASAPSLHPEKLALAEDVLRVLGNETVSEERLLELKKRDFVEAREEGRMSLGKKAMSILG